MVKRRRAKPSAPTKAKANGKDKALKPSHREETSNKNAKVLDSLEIVDDNPPGTKKAKLNSSQSPKSKRYVPPFTTSQRVSPRLQKARLNCERSERQSGSLEGIEDPSTDVFKRTREFLFKEESQEGTSAVVSASCQNKTDKMAPSTAHDPNQNDVEMKVEVIEEKQLKPDIEEDTGDESVLENGSEKVTEKLSDTLQKQCEINFQIVVSPDDKPKDDNTAVANEVCDQLLANYSYAKQRPSDQREIDRKCGDKKGPVNFVVNEIENLKKSTVNMVSTAIEDQQSNNMTVTTELGTNLPGPGLSDLEARINNVMSLQLSANICAEKEYIEGEVKEEPCSGGSYQYKRRGSAEEGKVKGMDEERGDFIKKEENSNLENLAKEKTPDKVDNIVLELLQDVITDVIETSNLANKKRWLMVYQKKPSADEIYGNHGEKSDLIPKVHETMNKSSSLSSQDIIKAILSEMIAFVTENGFNGSLSPAVRCEAAVSTRCTIANNPEKTLDYPVEESVAVTGDEIISVKSDFDCKCRHHREQSLDENDFANCSDKNSHNTGKAANTEIYQHDVMAVDSHSYSCAIEKVDCETINQDGLVSGNKNSQKTKTITQIVAKDISPHTSQFSLDSDGKIEDVPMIDKNVFENDLEVPEKVIKSPEQEVPVRFTPPSSTNNFGPTIEKDKDIVKAFNHDKEASWNENLTTCIPHSQSKELEAKVDINTPHNSMDEQSYTEEFKALEELLPADDMGLFDVIICQTKSVSDLPSGDSTIEFLINELSSLRCVVANYERALDDMKKQNKSNRRF